MAVRWQNVTGSIVENCLFFVCVRLSAVESSGDSGVRWQKVTGSFVVNCLFVLCAVECSGEQRCEWQSDGRTLLEVLW